MKARTRYVLMTSDYSAQEPRLFAQLSNSKEMINSYKQGRDLYSAIAAVAFHTTYEECLEHFPKDTPIKQIGHKWYPCKEDETPDRLADGETDVYADGKERRSQAKLILLGILYGRGERSVAEQLGCSIEEARVIKNDIYAGFPDIKRFEDESLRMAVEKGYVTTLWGHKRRLPEIRLPEYEFYYKTGEPVPEIEYSGWLYKLNNITHYRQKEKIKQEANAKGIIIKDNGGKIADASRQVINSRVQGCLAGYTHLKTKKGLFEIKDLLGEAIIWDGEEWTDCDIVYSGLKKLCMIELENGAIIPCSPDHKFLLTNGTWKKCSELNEDDDIMYQSFNSN